MPQAASTSPYQRYMQLGNNLQCSNPFNPLHYISLLNYFYDVVWGWCRVRVSTIGRALWCPMGDKTMTNVPTLTRSFSPQFRFARSCDRRVCINIICAWKCATNQVIITKQDIIDFRLAPCNVFLSIFRMLPLFKCCYEQKNWIRILQHLTKTGYELANINLVASP